MIGSMQELRTERVTVSLPAGLIDEVASVAGARPANRSGLVQESLRFYLRELRRRRMAEEAAKINAAEEEAMAEEAVETDLETWPEY